MTLPNAKPASDPPEHGKWVAATFMIKEKEGDRIAWAYYDHKLNRWVQFNDDSGHVKVINWCELHDLEAKLSEPTAREYHEWRVANREKDCANDGMADIVTDLLLKGEHDDYHQFTTTNESSQ